MDSTMNGLEYQIENWTGKFRFIVLSAHDSNIAAVLKSYGFNIVESVPFESDIEWELFLDDDS